MANRRRDVAKEGFWRDVLKRQTASGLIGAGVLPARATGRSVVLRLAADAALRDAERRPRQRAEARHQAAAAFVPVRLSDQPQRSSAFAIELAGGRVLRLPESIAAERLAELVRALEGRGPR